MERAGPQIVRGFTDHALETRLQLTRSAVRERHGQDAIRKYFFLFEKIGNAMREHARFAAAGAGEYQARAVGVLDGRGLDAIQLFSFYDHHFR
jgi:hypothetical protein